MNVNRSVRAILLLTLALGCKEQEKKHPQPTADSAETKEYFPVYDFLSTEISSVDSLPVGLKYYHTSNGRTDSGYITHLDFDKLAALFIPSEIKTGKFKNDFK